MIQEKWCYVLSVDGREIELTDGEVTLGRSRTSTVRVDHESVSRSHALLVFDKGLAILKDLNSSNGTYVGGRRVHNETKLADGDRIQLGAAVIGYRAVAPGPSDKTDLLTSDPVPPVPPAAPAVVAPVPVPPPASSPSPAAPVVAVPAAEAMPAMPVEAEPPSVPFPVLEAPPAQRQKTVDELSMEIEGGPTRRQDDIPAFRAQQAASALEAAAPAPPPAPVAAEAPPPAAAPPPLEIAAEELFRDVDARAGQQPSPAPVLGAAAAALEAVRVSAAPPEPPPPPAPPREPPPPPPVPRVPEEPRAARPATRSSRPERASMRPVQESSLSQMSFRESDIELSMMAPRPRPSGPPTARESADPPSLAGFFPRALANVVDLVILLAIDLLLSSPVFLILFFRVPGTGPDLALWGVSALCGILILAANLWYVVGGWAKNGRTPGKSLLGLAVVTSEARLGPGLGWRIAVIRLLGAGVAVLPLFAGYLMVLFRKDRRGLHDILANTWVEVLTV